MEAVVSKPTRVAVIISAVAPDLSLVTLLQFLLQSRGTLSQDYSLVFTLMLRAPDRKAQSHTHPPRSLNSNLGDSLLEVVAQVES